MKRKVILVFLSIVGGVLFTFFVLNKNVFYAKEEYLVYVLQAGAFKKEKNAIHYQESLPPSIIINENNLNKIYIGIYKNSDVLNKMIVFFGNKNINVYLKSIKVNKKFYKEIDNYEKILLKTESDKIYNKVNESVLNLYKDSVYEKNN